eukprot:CAMPEP_0197031876 /NCGR_PEP_ID=MMETSP1384-20130603/10718_1 /TAXON_ID=29189 /ORGANISM="Ammonia sp." /LENGTH=319 /DNA_ID=CAMNT_0042461455 /DNA_START=83 /DNA_END=1042 /DNA_ORIENTATION=-
MFQLLRNYQQEQTCKRSGNLSGKRDSNALPPLPLPMDVDIDLKAVIFSRAKTKTDCQLQPTSPSPSSQTAALDHDDVQTNNILQLLSECADRCMEFESPSDIGHGSEHITSIYKYPEHILKYIPQYSMEWRWTSQQPHVQLTDKDKQMIVNNESASIFSQRSVGTASVAIYGTDQFAVYANEHYVFEFKYLSSPLGAVLDAIIGITDSRFQFHADALGVGNQSECLNWGLRSDGIICCNNERVNAETDNLHTRFAHNDLIAIGVNTLDKQVCIQLSINGERKIDLNLSQRFKTISLPLKVTASAARGGGFSIVGGCKLK